MESHTAVEEAPTQESADVAPDNALENLPPVDPPEESMSFTDALEAALNPLKEEPVEETAEEPTEESTEQPAEESTSETTEQESTENTESNEPIEDLSEDVGDNWTPKAANRFKKLKEELKSNQSETDQLRQQLQEQEQKIKEMSGLVENRDIDQLQEKVSSYERDKVISDLESTEAYAEAVSQPLQKIISQAEEIADKYDVDPDALIDAISLDEADKQDEALLKLLPNASDRDKAKLYNIIDQIDPVLERRNHLMENAQEALEEAQAIEEQRRNEEIAEDARIRKVVTKNVAQRVTEKLPFLGGVEGFDMSSIQEDVSELNPETLHPVDFAYNAVASKLLPVIVKEYLQARREAESLTDQLATYEDAEPTMSGTPKGDSTKPVSSDLSFEDAIEHALGGR